MGIPAPLAELIAFEHAYRPIGQHVLSLGRQTVLINEMGMKRILKRHKLQWPNLEIVYDNLTVQARLSPDQRYITDETFWRALDVEHLDVLDISDYEKATIIHDMCRPIPEDWKGQYDFIFNGSILDNLFDPATAMRNISKMLTPGGRVCHAEMASNLAFEYLIYSPDWFWDYYAYNQFVDCKAYLCCFENLDQLLNGPWRIFYFNPKSTGESVTVPSLGFRQAVVVVFAEKGLDSTWDNTPIQWCYRSESDKAIIMEARNRFNVSPRPVFSNSSIRLQASEVEGFYDCGSI
ncbi:MAG: hypothetical protein HY787_23550 [Deltaproteobacteria bacterium]|nr:hypothetical protein [Deltaproteobacteria bacterium]